MKVNFSYKPLWFSFFLCIVLIVSSFTYQEHDFVVIESVGEGLSVVQYKGYQSKVEIPSLYQGKAIIAISGYKSFGKGVFQNSNVTHIVVPEQIKNIGFLEFGACKNLLQIELPKSLRNIDSYAFSDCINLEKITLPEGVTSIGNYVFYGCSKLSAISIESMIPPFLENNGNNLFLETSAFLKIFVPPSSVNDYKTAQGWIQYSNRIFSQE